MRVGAVGDSGSGRPDEHVAVSGWGLASLVDGVMLAVILSISLCQKAMSPGESATLWQASGLRPP
jgi:hypothetical protein